MTFGPLDLDITGLISGQSHTSRSLSRKRGYKPSSASTYVLVS